MQALSRRLHTVLHHPMTAPVVLFLLAVLTIKLDRSPHWDESVFMGQTAGRDGAASPPAFLGPTREIGSVWKLGALTWLAPDYPNLRLLHIMLSIAVIAIASWAVARATKLPTAVVGVVLGTYWVTFAYLGQLLRFVLVAFVLLLAVALFARSLDEDQLDVRRAVTLGGLFLLGLVLGPFEAGLVLACTGLYWLAVRPVWRAPAPLLAFSGTLALGGVLVLFLDTIPRYGSLSGRLAAIGDMTGPTSTSQFNWALLDDYAALLVTGPVSNARYAGDGRLPQLGYLLGAGLMALGVIALVRFVVRAVRRRPIRHFEGVAGLTFLVLVVLLAGFYSAQADRYFILPGSLLLVLGLGVLRDGARTVLARQPSTPPLQLGGRVAVVAALAVFALPNVVAADRLDEAWQADADVTAAAFTLVRELAEDEPCAGVARYNTPSVQWATGCSVRGAGSLEEALTVAADAPLSFVFWRANEVDAAVQAQLDAGGWTPMIVDPGVLTDQVWVRVRRDDEG